ncbi:MAG: T9SS type A sorting domain-containing protein [Flavobacteriales bacterium]|nr:T9SS type A sorting domain-containing protein [Flavobacteriales bacterium]
MKKYLLILIANFFAMNFSAQVIVKITQSPNNPLLLGVIDSQWADAVSTGWSTPDLTIAANSIEAELMFVDDTVSTGSIDVNGNPTWQDACEPLVNDLTGKIAVAYRSTCWHDIKAYYAQQAGAIGVILINRDPGPFSMGGSTYGSSITIPVVSIGSVEGDDLKNYIAMGGVHAFIGTKVGLNANDVGSSASEIIMAPHQSIPQYFAKNGTEFPLDLGLYVFNTGSNAQSNVTATAEVSKNGNVLYSNTSTPISFLAPVSVTVDTILISLGSYSPSSWDTGKYDIKYIVNLANDEDTSDNILSSSFVISNNVYSKSRINSLEEPISTTAYSLNEDITQYDDWEPCIVFKNSNASRGIAKGITFSCAPVNFMTGEIIETRAYQWNDAFVDLSAGNPTFNSLIQLSSAFYYYADESENGININLPFDDDVILADNQKYLFCIYNASDELRVGYDVGIDYSSTIDHYLQPVCPVKTLPNGQSAVWYWAGFGTDASPAFTVNMDSLMVGINEKTSENSLIPFPNPAVNLLTIPVNKSKIGNVSIEAIDISGKIVLSENSIINGNTIKVNIASIKNGTYLFLIKYADGTQEKHKISVNR